MQSTADLILYYSPQAVVKCTVKSLYFYHTRICLEEKNSKMAIRVTAHMLLYPSYCPNIADTCESMRETAISVRNTF